MHLHLVKSDGQSSADVEPLPQFLDRVRSMSSARYKPADGGVHAHNWSFFKHFERGGLSGGIARRGAPDKRGA